MKRFTKRRRRSAGANWFSRLKAGLAASRHAVRRPAAARGYTFQLEQPWLLALVFVALLGLLLYYNYQLWLADDHGVRKLQRLDALVAEQEQHIRELQARNDVLKNEIASLKQGQDALEERARYELGMIRDGETFIQIVPAE